MAFDDLAIRAARDQFRLLGRVAQSFDPKVGAPVPNVDVVVEPAVEQYPDDGFTVSTGKKFLVHLKLEQVSAPDNDDVVNIDGTLKYRLGKCVMRDGYVATFVAVVDAA